MFLLKGVSRGELLHQHHRVLPSKSSSAGVFIRLLQPRPPQSRARLQPGAGRLRSSPSYAQPSVNCAASRRQHRVQSSAQLSTCSTGISLLPFRIRPCWDGLESGLCVRTRVRKDKWRSLSGPVQSAWTLSGLRQSGTGLKSGSSSIWRNADQFL